MTIDLTKSKIEILRELAEKLFTEAPEYFDTTLAFTENNFIYSTNKTLLTSKDSYKELLKNLNPENIPLDGVTHLIPRSTNSKNELVENICLMQCMEETNSKDQPVSKQEVIFNFLHEAVHILLMSKGERFKENHNNEVFADVGAYLLYLREVGYEDEFIKFQPFERAVTITNKAFYGEAGSHYTTEALLGAKHLAKALNIAELSIEDIKNIAATAQVEFSLEQEDRDDLYNIFTDNGKIEASISQTNILNVAIDSTDKETYRTARMMTLSSNFQKAASFKEYEEMLQKKDRVINLILDPIEDWKSQGEECFTEKYVQQLIKDKPQLGVK